jgi:hypothetical protein
MKKIGKVNNLFVKSAGAKLKLNITASQTSCHTQEFQRMNLFQTLGQTQFPQEEKPNKVANGTEHKN